MKKILSALCGEDFFMPFVTLKKLYFTSQEKIWTFSVP